MIITIILCAAAFVFAALIYAEIRRNKTALVAMPTPTWIERYEVDAILRDYTNAVLVLGTGSMRPTIRAGRHDEVVAVVIYDNSRDYDTLGEGLPVLFKHVSGLIVHQLAKLTPAGWITTGSANAGYDTGTVTRANLRGVVVKIFNIKP
jgi:hypothetical protein